jgi:hypothetical protein
VQQRVGADKLAVVLIDVDPAYFKAPEQYLPKARKVLDRHKLDWPNAIAQNGFNDTMGAFNVSGYGNIVVDARGIVRGVNLHGKELERAIDDMMKATEKDSEKPIE